MAHKCLTHHFIVHNKEKQLLPQDQLEKWWCGEVLQPVGISLIQTEEKIAREIRTFAAALLIVPDALRRGEKHSFNQAQRGLEIHASQIMHWFEMLSPSQRHQGKKQHLPANKGVNEPSPGTYCEHSQGLTSFIPISRGLADFQPQCCQINCFCSQIQVC